MEVKFGLVVVADGYGQDTFSQGKYCYYNLVKTLPPKLELGESERNRGQHWGVQNAALLRAAVRDVRAAVVADRTVAVGRLGSTDRLYNA